MARVYYGQRDKAGRFEIYRDEDCTKENFVVQTCLAMPEEKGNKYFSIHENEETKKDELVPLAKTNRRDAICKELQYTVDNSSEFKAGDEIDLWTKLTLISGTVLDDVYPHRIVRDKETKGLIVFRLDAKTREIPGSPEHAAKREEAKAEKAKAKAEKAKAKAEKAKAKAEEAIALAAKAEETANPEEKKPSKTKVKKGLRKLKRLASEHPEVAGAIGWAIMVYQSMNS